MAKIKVIVDVDRTQLDKLKSDLAKPLKVSVDANSVASANKQMQTLDGSTKGAQSSVSGLNGSMNSLGGAVGDVGKKSETLLGSLYNKVRWDMVQKAILAVGNAFRSALESMQEVDTQLTNVAKVSDATQQELQALGDKAYSTASKYGVSAGQYMEAVYEYTKAGFGDTADELGELSTKAMLVGDTTASVADKFIIAANAAWEMGGDVKRLSQLVDEADFINNNYATTLAKIAEGFPRVASVANMAGMSAEETMAALGTITATTQETASKAGTALRALVLNILGDTTTEVEEGVTVTTEQVDGLRSALEKYAGDVVEAADATGTLINPMEALAALAESYKNGDLTESGLFEIEEALGGKLRTNQLDALLKNFDMYQEMLEGMADSAGTADAEIDTMLTSWKSKTEILKNTWAEFVQKSFSPNLIKGFIDGITQLLKLFGDLGHMLGTVAGAIAALKFASVTRQLNQHARALEISIQKNRELAASSEQAAAALEQQSAELAKTQAKAQAFRAIGTIIGIATAAYTAYTMARNNYLNSLSEAYEQAQSEADAAASEAESLLGMVQAYEQAESAYESGVGSKEALETASKNLAEALGLEGEAVSTLKDKYKELTMQELEEAKQKQLTALQAAIDNFAARFTDDTGNGFIDAVVDAIIGSNPAASQEQKKQDEQYEAAQSYEGLKKYIDEYKKYKKLVDEITAEINDAGGLAKLSKERQEQYEEATAYVEEYADALEPIIAAQDALEEINEQQADLARGDLSEYGDALEGVADKEEEERKRKEELAASYDDLANKVTAATEALEAYNEATSSQKGDTWKGMADAYQKAMDDINNGLLGSNNVSAAAELLFSDEQINAARAKGISAAEMLMSDFLKAAFTYTDEEGNLQYTGGEDNGSNLAYFLFGTDSPVSLMDGWTAAYDEAGNKIISKNGEIAASFKKTTDENGVESLDVVVEDFEALGDALNLEPGALAAWLEALGNYSGEFQMATDDILEFADAIGAIKSISAEGTVLDASTLISELAAAGKSVQEIWNWIDKIQNTPGITLDVNTTEELQQLINETITPVVDADTEEAEKKGETVQDKLDEIDSTTATPSVGLDTDVFDRKYWQTKLKLKELENATGDKEPLIKGQLYFRNVPSNTGNQGAGSGPPQNIAEREASGTSNAKGGPTLVNEGNGPEIIVENGMARIAGNGLPVITNLTPGATVFNAEDTKAILRNSGIQAFKGGTAGGIKRWTGGKNDTTTEESVGSTQSQTNSSASSARSSDNGYSEAQEAELERLKSIVSLRESELDLLEAQESPIRDQILKLRQIQDAIKDQIQYMQSIGASQEEINELTTKWYNLNSDIADLQNDMLDQLSKGVQTEIDRLNEKRDEELEALEKQYETTDDQLDLEEKLLAVQEAEARLAEAQNDRTVRYYNALTGQWEWGANAQDVKSAEEDLADAKEALEEAQKDAEYEAKKQEINDRYDAQEKQWQDVLDALEEPAVEIVDAINELSRSATKMMRSQIEALNKLLEKLGYHIDTSNLYDSGGVLKGIGGIKATRNDEMILPPEITDKLLSPVAGSRFRERVAELGFLYGANASGMRYPGAGFAGTQYNGNVYQYGNITLTEQQAKTTSVYELARLSRSLRVYNATR